MRSAFLVLGFLAACNPDKIETDDSAPPVEEEFPLTLPFVSWVNAIDQSAGALKSTCEFGIELYDEDGVFIAETEGGGNGRQWAALQLQENILVDALALWSDCTNYVEGYGQQNSGAFSGSLGDIFVFHYDGLEVTFDSLRQEEDFESGIVEAEFIDGYTADPDGLVAQLPQVTATEIDATHWRYEWEDTTNPVEVLAAISTTRDYVTGSPMWIDQPPWW